MKNVPQLAVITALLATILSMLTASLRAQDASLDVRRERIMAIRNELEARDFAASQARVRWHDGHSSSAYRVRFSPKGDRVLTCGTDGRVFLWDAWASEMLAGLGFHSTRAYGVTADFGAAGERVLVFDAVASTASLYDGRGGELLADLHDPETFIRWASFTPDGLQIVTLTDDAKFSVWDSDSGFRTADFDAGTNDLRRLELNPDSKSILGTTRNGLGIVWTIADGKRAGRIGNSRIPIRIARWNKDKSEFIATDGRRRVDHWSLKDDRVDRPGTGEIDSHRIVMGPNGRRYAAFMTEGYVELRNVAAPGKTVEVSDAEDSGNQWLRQLVDWSPDGRYVAFREPAGSLVVYRTDDGVEVVRHEILGWADTPKGAAPKHSLRFSKDGTTVALVDQIDIGKQVINFWNTADSSMSRVVEESSGTVLDAAFSDDGSRFAAISFRGYATVYQTRKNVPPRILGSHARFDIGRPAPSGAFIMSGTWSAEGDPSTVPVTLWNPTTGLPRQSISSPGVWINPAVLSSDESRIVTTSWADPPQLTKFSRSGIRSEMRKVETGEVIASRDQLPLPSTGIDYSPAGDRILFCYLASTAELVDAATMKLVRKLEGIAVTSDYSYAGRARYGPLGGLIAGPGENGNVLTFDGKTGEPRRVLVGHENIVRFIQFSPDGRVLLTCSRDGTARLWDLDSGQSTHELGGHKGGVYHGAFSPDGRLVVTAGEDRLARVWDASTGKEVATLSGHAAPLRSAWFDPDGGRVVTGDDGGGLRVWDVASGDLIHELIGHTASVKGWGAVFSHDGSRVFSLAADSTFRIWNPADGRLLFTRVAYAGGEWLGFTPEGHYVGTERAAEWARINVNGSHFPLSSYASILKKPAAVAKRLTGRPARRVNLMQAPEAVITSPASGGREDRDVDIEVMAKDRYGIASITLTRDGVLLKEHAVEKKGVRQLRHSFKARLPSGTNMSVFGVRVRNIRGIKSRPVSIHLRYEAPKRELYVLAIGVADYDKDGMDLRYPVKDADDIIKALSRQEGLFYHKVHVERLVDREVKSSAIARLRDKYLRLAKPEDTIAVFVAGHGMRTDSNEYWFMTSAATPDDPYEGVSRHDIEQLVTSKKLNAQKRVLFIDTCYSGKVFGEGTAVRGVDNDLFDQGSVNKLADQEGQGIFVLAASADDQFARENKGNGLFTKALLDGMAGAADANKDGFVEVEELMSFTRTEVLDKSGGRQRPTIPKIDAGGGFRLAKALGYN